ARPDPPAAGDELSLRPTRLVAVAAQSTELARGRRPPGTAVDDRVAAPVVPAARDHPARRRRLAAPAGRRALAGGGAGGRQALAHAMMTERGTENGPRLDALLPREMARRAEEIGARKVAMDALGTLALAVLAGAFIALGGVFATTTLAGAGTAPWGAMRVLAGVTFSLGLILVIVGGAEL